LQASRKEASASGLRHRFPVQTKRILNMVGVEA
jgi:hypothetical protein